jgi:signal transduction histidine kinase
MTEDDTRPKQTKVTTTGNNPAIKPSQLKTQKIAVPLVRADLMALTGDLAGRRFTIAQNKTVIGRDPEAQIQLTGSDVSRKHAVIGHTASGEFVIEDLKSRNGTLVNGVPIEVHVLKFGDKIQVGSRTLFVFTHHQALEEELVQWQRIELIAQMTAGLVHDFNNYMTALLGYVQYLQDFSQRNLSKEDLLDLLGNCLPVMESAAREGSNLARKVLTFARGSSRPQIPIDLKPVIKEALSLVEPSFKKPIRIETQLGSGLRIIGERTEMLQVLINLFLNARDAMPDGGRLRIEGEVCHVDGDQALALQANEQVLVRVIDTGVGMDEETQKRIFEPMFTTKAAAKGTGLGLSMVSRIIEGHGGMIRVDSEPGSGSTFTIYLPIAEARTTPLKVNTTLVLQHLETQPGTDRRRESGLVLLQEADDMMRQRAARALCSLGFEVLFGNTVEQILEVFERYGARVRLVVLDAGERPRADEIRGQIRAVNPRVRIVFSSRDSDEIIPQRVRARLMVPCDTRTFQQIIREVMKDDEGGD